MTLTLIPCIVHVASPPTTAPLFDTGANPTSFVNRQVAAWIELQQSNLETDDEIIAMITFEGSTELQEQLRSLCREYIDIFSTSVRSLPAQIDSMVIEIDQTKWEVPRNRLPPRHHSAEKQLAIRTQVNKLLELGVIEESQASEWSQVHQVPKSDGSWRIKVLRAGLFQTYLRHSLGWAL